MNGALSKNFSDKIDFNGDCWIWTAYKDKNGYGTFNVNRKKVLAHRYYWKFLNGDIPKGMCILHKCDNPTCVKPDHLFMGTHQENMQDRDFKRRLPYGENHKCSKLTQLQVDEIRNLYKSCNNGEFSSSELAKKFNVSGSQIIAIAKNRSWKIQKEESA